MTDIFSLTKRAAKSILSLASSSAANEDLIEVYRPSLGAKRKVTAESLAGLFNIFTSSEQSFTNGSQFSVAHGFPGVPKFIILTIKNATTQYGYSVGDTLVLAPGTDVFASNTGVATIYDATNITIRVATSGIALVRKDTFNIGIVTPGNWRIIITAIY
jgi:hypothetical protein